MARRNFGGVGLVAVALVVGGLLWGSKKRRSGAGPEPTDLGSGWEVNDLCTNADLLDPDRAIAVGSAWAQERALPPPVSNEQRASQLRLFFADTFGQCDESSTPQVLHGNAVMSFSEWAEMIGSGVDMQADPDRRQLMRVGKAILGLREAQVGQGPTGRIQF